MKTILKIQTYYRFNWLLTCASLKMYGPSSFLRSTIFFACSGGMSICKAGGMAELIKQSIIAVIFFWIMAPAQWEWHKSWKIKNNIFSQWRETHARTFTGHQWSKNNSHTKTIIQLIPSVCRAKFFWLMCMVKAILKTCMGLLVCKCRYRAIIVLSENLCLHVWMEQHRY